MHPFGKIERKNPVWFKVGISELELAIVAALLRYKRAAREDTRCVQEHRIGSNADSISRKCANKHWNSLCHRIELTAA